MHYSKFRIKLIILLILLLSIPLVIGLSRFGADNTALTKNYFTKRYIRIVGDLEHNDNTDRVIALMERGAAIGYNGIVLSDTHGEYNSIRSATYQTNAQRVVQKGQELDMAIIPDHFSSDDPYYDAADKTTIMEALPVEGTRYLVDPGVDGSGNNTTSFAGDHDVTVLNGSFENWSGNTPSDFWVDGAGTYTFRDQTVSHTGSNSLRVDNPPAGAAARLENSVTLTVEPNVSYTMSAWVKTQDLTNPGKFEFAVYGYPETQQLFMSYTNPISAQGIASTQDWKKYSLIFTTQAKTEVRLYAGMWGANSTGSYWVDDLSLTENGMTGNLVNRASLNPVIRSADSNTTYLQNQDYLLTGSTITIPPTSTLNPGDYLRVDWYQEPLGRDREASACYDEYFNYLKTDGLRLQSYFGNPKGYMSSYDEWRTANWDPVCKALNGGEMMTGGQYMAYAFQRTYNLIKEIRSDADIYVWDDMFDPYANAVDNYYSVNGSIDHSWDGVPTDTIIINWNTQQTVDSGTGMSRQNSSLKFYSDRGNPQILSMSGLGAANNFLNGLSQLEATYGNITKVDGFMYTSWSTGPDGYFGDYTNLEAMAQLVKNAGRWGATTSSLPTATAPTFTYKDKTTIQGTKGSDMAEILINDLSEGVIINGNSWSVEVELPVGVASTFSIKSRLSTGEITNPINISITRRKPADANADGTANIRDFASLMANWGQTGISNIADFNEDGKVNILDFSILMKNWGK